MAVHVFVARGLDGGGVAVAERVLARGGRGRVAVDDLAARRAERDGDLARAAVRGALRRLRADWPVTYSFCGDRGAVAKGDSRTGQDTAHERRGPAGERLARGEPREAVVDELAVGLAAGDGRGADRDLRRAPDPRGQLLVGVGEPLELVGL